MGISANKETNLLTINLVFNGVGNEKGSLRKNFKKGLA
jgi:hypothetical protein